MLRSDAIALHVTTVYQVSILVSKWNGWELIPKVSPDVIIGLKINF